MLFLIPYQQQRPTSSNIKALDSENSVDDPDVAGLSVSQNIENEADTSTAKQPQQNIHRPTKQKSTPNTSTTPYEIALLNILKAKQEETIGEDKHFALSLVPMLAKLNEDQKHYAKIEILNAIRNAKYYRPPPAFQQLNLSVNNTSDPTHFSVSRHSPNSEHSNSMQDYYSQFSNDVCSPTGPASSLNSDTFDLSNP